MKTTNLCDSCLNKKTCSKICRPVEIWLREGQTLIFEDKIGNVTVNYGLWKEVRFGELQNANASDDVWKDTIESTFADPNERNRSVLAFECVLCNRSDPLANQYPVKSLPGVST